MDRNQRLAELLPILRCPKTGQRLIKHSDQELMTELKECSWPILHGRPVFIDPVDRSLLVVDDHTSHQPPPYFLEQMKEAPGWVLHMSAGGSAEVLPNVVELEMKIFRNTDFVADAHELPFMDNTFEIVVAVNAFEHYADPARVAREINRVLKPGGHVFIHTAFLQPLHEAPWHYYNCTEYGLLKWFSDFKTVELNVSGNFNPIFALSWMVAECEKHLRSSISAKAAKKFLALPMSHFVKYWHTPTSRTDRTWDAFMQLPQEVQRHLAAGFEFIGKKM